MEIARRVLAWGIFAVAFGGLGALGGFGPGSGEVLAEETGKVDPSRREYYTPGLVLETGARNAACDVLRFTRDGRYVLTAGDDKVVRNWRVTPQGLVPSEMPILRWRIFREVRGNIYAMDLSPDQKSVLVAGHGMQGMFAASVIDRESGNILAATNGGNGAVKAQGTVWSAAFSPSGKRVVLGTEEGIVWLWEPDGGALRPIGDYQISKADIKAALGKVFFVGFQDENTIISVAGDGRMVRWNLSGGAPVLLHQFPGRIATPLALSPDGSLLGACLEKAEVNMAQVVSFPAGRPESPLRFPKEQFPHKLAFSGDSKRLAIAVREVGQNAGFLQEQGGFIALFDRTLNQQTATRGPEQGLYAEALAFAPNDSNLLAVAGGNDHEVVLWNLATRKKVGDDLKSPGSCLWSVALDDDARYVAFQDQRNPAAPSPNQRGIGPWRYFDLKVRKFVDARNRPFVPAPPLETAGGWRVLTSIPGVQEADKWFVQKNGAAPVELPWSRILDEFPRCYAFLPEKQGRPTRLLVGHYWGVSMFELGADGPRRIRLFKGHEGYVTSMAVSKNGKKLVTSSRDQTLAGWDLDDWPWHPSLGAQVFRQNDAAGQPALKIGKVELGSSFWETGLSTGDQIVLVVIGVDNIVYNASGKYGENTGTVDDALAALRRPTAGDEIYLGWRRPGDKILYEQLTTVQDRPLWRFFPMRDKEWVLWRWRDYYYDTSTNGDFQIGWQRSGDITTTPAFFRAEQFRKKFLRPDLVSQTLTGWKSEQGLVRFQQFEPPKVEMAVSTDRVDGNDVDINIRVLPQGTLDNQAPARVIVWLNDYEFKIWQRAELARDGDAYVVRARLPQAMFRRGQNLVTAQCYSKAELRGEATPYRIECVRPYAPPKMVGLVVGVGDYTVCQQRRPKQEASFANLRSTNDADVVHKALLSQKGKLYASVELKLLKNREKNREATPNSVLAALDALAKKVGPDDLLVFHLGGHGVQTSELNDFTTEQERFGLGAFLFCFGDFDLRNLQSTTLSFEQLSARFVKMPCHKILIIDACHSGDTKSDLETKESPIRVMTRDGVGPVILTSCDPKQFAQEDNSGTIDPSGGFGFFTIGIRRVLEEPEAFAAADRDRNGILDAEEFALGIRAQVAKIVRQLDEEKVRDEDGKKIVQDPVYFVPRLLERLPVAKK
jgi:WD40 repeat protein